MANFLTRHLPFLGGTSDNPEIKAAIEAFQEKVAYKALAMYIATSYIANALSKCEIQVYRNGEEVKDLLYYRLNVAPNPNQSGAQFINELVTRICTTANALVIPYKDDFFYLADSYSVDKRPLKDFVFKGISVEGQEITRPKQVKASDAFYFQLESRNVNALVAELYKDYARLMGASIESYIQNHGRKYKLKLANTKVGDKKFNDDYEKVIKNQLKTFLESENAVYPEFQGYDLEEMRHESDGGSEDILAVRKEIFDVVAQAYKIPTSMMYGNTNNTAEVIKQFLTFAVDPIAQMMSDEMTRKCFTFEEWKQGSYVSIDTKRINHVDIFDVADKVDKLISSGVFSIDSVLSALGYQPLGTEFSEAHYITKNYELADDAMNRISGGGESE